MLVLTRKPNESILIDGGIEVTFLGLKDGKARIGIVAPESTKILRREVFDRMEKERTSADQGQP